MDSDTLTADDLLRQQEQEPLRKRRRLSYSDADSDEASSESGSDEYTSSNDNDGFQVQVDSSLEDHSRFSNRETTTRFPKPQATFPAKSCTFSSLGLSAALQAALNSMSIKLPTEIQAACIPPLLEGKRNSDLLKSLKCLYLCKGRDCIGNAKTGSGKTIAFALPILQKLSLDPYGIFALVLTPTR
jgi:ATP-dependent RNA helicase DDX49/DBP8